MGWVKVVELSGSGSGTWMTVDLIGRGYGVDGRSIRHVRLGQKDAWQASEQA